MPNLVSFAASIAELGHEEKSCNQSVTQSLTHPAYLMPWEQKHLRFGKKAGHRGTIYLHPYFIGKGHHPPTTVSVRKLTSDCPFVWYQNICSASFSCVTIHTSDRRIERIATEISCIALHAVAR